MADRPADWAGTPKAFVALLVFWLALLFASFGLFAPPNLTSTVTLTLCALAVTGAVAMFLELEQGFGGLVRISPEPMRGRQNFGGRTEQPKCTLAPRRAVRAREVVCDAEGS